jgi:biotin carboxylase
MNAYILLNKIFTSLVTHWEGIYSPADTELFYIVSKDVYNKILELDHIKFFKKIYIQDDFSHDALVKLLEPLIKELKEQNYNIKIATSGSELDLLTVVKLREHFNLPGPKLAQINRFIDKTEMKDVLAESGCGKYLPKYTKFDKDLFRKDNESYVGQVIAKLSLPVFVKPNNLAGAMDTAKFLDRKSLLEWCLSNQNSTTEFEFNEYITGTFQHADSIIINNEVHYMFISRYMRNCFEFTTGKAWGSIILPPQSKEYKSLHGTIKEILRGFVYIPNGFTHMEFFNTNNGVKFIEMGARPPGANHSRLCQIFNGFDIMAMQYKFMLGLPVDLTETKGKYAAFVWFPKIEGKVKEFRNVPKLDSILDCTYAVNIGDRLEKAKSVFNVAVKIMLANQNYEQLSRDFDALSDFEPIIYED